VASRKRQARGRSVKGGRVTTVPPAPNAIPLVFSSGYKGYLRPLPYQTFRRLREREEELFPEPPMPVETTQTDSGPVQTPVPQDSAAGLTYLVTLNTVAAQRAAYRLDFILDHFLGVEGDGRREGVAGEKAVPAIAWQPRSEGSEAHRVLGQGAWTVSQLPQGPVHLTGPTVRLGLDDDQTGARQPRTDGQIGPGEVGVQRHPGRG